MSARLFKTKAERKKIVRAVLRSAMKGQSLKIAVRLHGISYTTFRNWALSEGIEYTSTRGSKYDTWTEEQRRKAALRAVTLCRKGQTMRQVQQQLGVGRHIMERWVSEFGLTLEWNSPGVKGYSQATAHANVEMVINMMELGATMGQACASRKTCTGSIHKWANATQRERLRGLMDAESRHAKAKEARSFYISHGDELEQLFSSSEPLGWE